MKRAAARTDTLAERAGMETWSCLYRRYKWRFAGKLARADDNRWSKLVLEWQPTNGAGRTQGSPCTRWSDPLVKFAGADWMDLARDPEQWEAAEDVFAKWLFYKR